MFDPLVVLTTIFTVGRSFVAIHNLARLGQPNCFGRSSSGSYWLGGYVLTGEFVASVCLLEFDAFVFFAWPFIVPYYLYRTRGRRGLFLVTGIYGLYLMPYFAAQIVRIALVR